MIDTVEIAEKLKATYHNKLKAEKQLGAADALMWFRDYALDNITLKVKRNVLRTNTIRPVASATVKVDATYPYLEQAFKEYEINIIKRAIELAKDDLYG